MTEQRPEQILSPLNALTLAAQLNNEAMEYVGTADFALAEHIATVALSLSTYAAAMYQREELKW